MVNHLSSSSPDIRQALDGPIINNHKVIKDWIDGSTIHTNWIGERKITSGGLTMSLYEVVKKIEEKISETMDKKASSLPGATPNKIFTDPNNNPSVIVTKLISMLDDNYKNLNWVKRTMLKIREMEFSIFNFKIIDLNPYSNLYKARDSLISKGEFQYRTV